MSDSQSNRRFRRAKVIDTVARWGITLGGAMVVLAIIGIFVEIAAVTLPLFRSPRAEPIASVPPEVHGTLAVGADDYGQMAWRLLTDGTVAFYDLPPRALVTSIKLFAAPTTIANVVRLGPKLLALARDDGGIAFASIDVVPRFAADGSRSLQPTAEIVAESIWRLPPGSELIAAAHSANTHALAALLDGEVYIFSSSKRHSLLGGSETVTDVSHLPAPAGVAFVAGTMDQSGGKLAVADNHGSLWRYVRDKSGDFRLQDTTHVGGTITAIAYLLGDVSLAIGRSDGSLGIWFDVRGEDGSQRLQQIHRLEMQPAAVARLVPAPLSKAVASIDALGVSHIDHATSNRRLVSLAARQPLTTLAFNGRGNVVAAADVSGALHVWRLIAPHPEISVGTLFGKVWYEGYDAPAYVWQSSSGTADFEPKLSLIPLIFGTLKATFYAMLFSVPVALLAAIYASQFLGQRYHRLVKPVVELMAAFPSVVIGFLAALWLAPKLEVNVVGFIACAALLPAIWWSWIPVWRRIESRYQKLRGRPAIEYLILLPLLWLGIKLGLALGTALESSWFAGSFQQWLYDSFGVRYDQRNSIVIAFALGFAVVPLIFTMADDALSNVPKNLIAASLALGASRWQTVWKVVLPSASPGIFAAVMIGFGRAVGETMIVLMAAGNTPILDWSAFNGMRTLAANIAVEIPEAPHGGTLYRVLFLSALILFTMTFVANTLAEIVRARLRSRYGRF